MVYVVIFCEFLCSWLCRNETSRRHLSPYCKIRPCLLFCVFSKTVENNRDFSDFLQKWIELYDNKKDFIFIFDTKNVEDVTLRYSFKMAIFIK